MATESIKNKNNKVKAEVHGRQIAALPFRYAAAGSLEVLIITSRETGRFLIPKGWPMKGRTDHEAAAVEAREEAGVVGKVHCKSVGKYIYWKRLADQFRLVEVDVYGVNSKPGKNCLCRPAKRFRLRMRLAARLSDRRCLSSSARLTFSSPS
jgi:8-oxo-dGTP pyrophosphatase MutT (NUDIX family)